MGDFRFEIWPTENRRITQHFGVNPHNYAQFGLPGHDGVDIEAPMGSKIFCVADGEVYRVHDKPAGHNYGVHVRVAHQDGFRTIYGHLEKATVQKGQIVEAGTVLGLADSTGNSFGNHLHLTLKLDGAKVGNWPYEIIDPTSFLLPLLGWSEPAGPYVEGWVLSASIFKHGNLAQVNTGGATVYFEAGKSFILPAGSVVAVLGERRPYAKIRVARATIGIEDGTLLRPAPEPPPIIATVDGWGWERRLSISDEQAVVGSLGVQLRAGPGRDTQNIGIIKAGSTVSVLGPVSDEFRPIRARRNDFIEPVNLVDPPPDADQLPPEEGILGWVLTQYLSPMEGHLALASRYGVNLRSRPDEEGRNIGLVKAYATVRLAGESREEYTPILVRKADVLNVNEPVADVAIPDPLAAAKPPDSEPVSDELTVAGWLFTRGLIVMANTARIPSYGGQLREAPQRDARIIGFLPPDTLVIVAGSAQGEYTPVRVWERVIEPPKIEDGDNNPESQLLGRALIGLHASLETEISEEEHQEFEHFRPGITKILSSHRAEDISRLAAAHPEAAWIIRTSLAFDGRHVTPAQFVKETISDTRRALDQLAERNVVVELHNEPNTAQEGLGGTWTDGHAFDKWWLEVLGKFRRSLPGIRYLYPGLSPGSSVIGVKQDHIQFVEASRAAVEAADGIGVHIFWSDAYQMGSALAILDDYISRFRDRPIWITEAGWNGQTISAEKTAGEYLRFWEQIQSRPIVRGVTFLAANARQPETASQIWVGRGIGKLVGNR